MIIENALSQNRMLRGPQAFELGIADAMFEPADFLEESLRWVARVLTGGVIVSRPPVNEDWAGAVAAARFFTDGKVHGEAPAPDRTWHWLRRRGTAAGTRGSPPRTRPSPS